MNFLHDLFYDAITPNQKRICPDSEYAKYCKIKTENWKKLKIYLSALPDPDEKQQVLDELVDAHIEIGCFLEYERFIEGFRPGAGMMLYTFVAPQQSVIRDIS